MRTMVLEQWFSDLWLPEPMIEPNHMLLLCYHYISVFIAMSHLTFATEADGGWLKCHIVDVVPLG
jgi:hypothetical protein